MKDPLNRQTLNPLSSIIRIQKIKYLWALIPIALVAISFVGKEFFGLEAATYLAPIGLVTWLAVLFTFRYGMVFHPAGKGQCLAPVHGVVEKIETRDDHTIITIGKSLLARSDIRSPLPLEEHIETVRANRILLKDASETVSLEIIGNALFMTESDENPGGKLIGFSPLTCRAVIRFPGDWKLEIQEKARVQAGVSVLAQKNINPTEAE